jgi:hypothetical protein
MQQPPTEDDCDYEKRRREYLDERNVYIQAGIRSIESFDRAMLTLVAGALGLSLLLLEKVLLHPILCTCLLVSSWIAMASSLLCVIVSFLLSRKSLDTLRQRLDADFRDDPPKEDAGRGEPANYYALAVTWLNWLSIATFIVGVVLLILFCTVNLSREPSMTEREIPPVETKVPITKGDPGWPPSVKRPPSPQVPQPDPGPQRPVEPQPPTPQPPAPEPPATPPVDTTP